MVLEMVGAGSVLDASTSSNPSSKACRAPSIFASSRMCFFRRRRGLGKSQQRKVFVHNAQRG